MKLLEGEVLPGDRVRVEADSAGALRFERQPQPVPA